MTREEAISCFHKFMNNEPISIPTLEKAMQVAIKALEQEPKSEWEHDHEILRAYSNGANEALDKIRAEIETEPYISKMEVLEMLDKYKAESEVEDGNSY